MNELIYLDMLNVDSVSVRKQKVINVEGIPYPIGDIWRRSYENSASGRLRIQDELLPPYIDAVFAVWGDTPTVSDEEE